jgi:hypothetical protein
MVSPWDKDRTYLIGDFKYKRNIRGRSHDFISSAIYYTKKPKIEECRNQILEYAVDRIKNDIPNDKQL